MLSRHNSDERQHPDVTGTQEEIMQARMTNPAALLPDAVKAINLLYKAAHCAGVDPSTLELVHLRASQINGCSPCVDSGARNAKKNGETDERLFAVAVWRDTPYFTEDERAALALAEAATRLADRADAVPDDVWADAAEHFGEKELAGIVLWVATTNFFNRLNAPTRQQAPQNWG
jgi:AhpD family alkylhydroperoxidase